MNLYNCIPSQVSRNALVIIETALVIISGVAYSGFGFKR